MGEDRVSNRPPSADSVSRRDDTVQPSILSSSPLASSSGKERVEPLAEPAQRRRKEHAGNQSRQRQGPAQQGRLVREHADGAHEGLGGEKSDEGAGSRAAPEEIGHDG